MRWISLATVLALAAVGFSSIDASSAKTRAGASAVGGGKGGQPPSPPKLPPPPPRVGCYRFRTDAWLRVACATQKYVRSHFPHPELEDGVFSSPVEQPPAAPSFVFGSLSLRFVKVGSEEDIYINPKTKVVTRTPNSWSIQNNAIFVGSNKQEDGIQFAEQSPRKGPVGICIWQVDITTQTYPTTCTTTSPVSVPLTAGDTANLSGYIRAGGLLAFVATAPGRAKAYAVVAKDKYGLAGRWQNITGSILGFGEGSHAEFSSAEVETFVDVETCIGESGSATCPREPRLKGHAYTSFNGQTAETNDLIPVIGSPPEFLPSLEELVVDQANIKYVSTTTGSCPSGSPPLCGLAGAGNG
jgi:hypothetical protein